MGLVLLVLSGLIAGCVHVVTGPDHLAALMPLAIEDPKRAVGQGFRWGIGHGLGALILGGIGILARSAIDVDAISAWAEVAAGVALVVIGLWSLRKASQIVVHAHPHEHDGETHHHVHVHANEEASGPEHDGGVHGAHAHAAFWVGMIHGAAGTGHLFAVLPSLALPPRQAAIYLVAYFIAAVGSMSGFAWVMGRWARDRGALTLRRAMYGASCAAVCVGLFWLGNAWPG